MRKLFFYILSISAGILLLANWTYADTDFDEEIRLLEAKQASIRAEASKVLLKNIEATFEKLTEIAQNSENSLRLRIEAIKIIGKSQKPEAIDVLLAMINNNEPSVIITALTELARFIPDQRITQTIEGLITEISEVLPEIAIKTLMIVEEFFISECFMQLTTLVYNISTDKINLEPQVVAVLGSAACTLFSKADIDENTSKNFIFNFGQLIKKYDENLNLKSSLIFSFAKTSNAQAIDKIISLIQKLEFINKADIEERTLRNELDKEHKDQEIEPEELSKKHEALEAKILKLKDVAIKAQMKINYKAAEILAIYFDASAFEKFASVIADNSDIRILDTFNQYVNNCSAEILKTMVKEFEKPEPAEPEADASEEITSEYKIALQKHKDYFSNLKFAIESHIRSNQKSVEVLFPLNQFYNNLQVADNLLDALSNIALPNIVAEMSKEFEPDSKASDAIKILILEKFKNITSYRISGDLDKENYNPELVSPMLINPVLAALKEDSEDVFRKALEVINSKPFIFEEQQYEILRQITRIIESSQSDEIITLGCEVLVNISPRDAVKAMLNVINSVTESKPRTQLYEAFAKVPFNSPRDKTVFINLAKDDLLNKEKPMHLRESAAKAIRATQDSEAVTVILDALRSATEENEGLIFKGILVEQLNQLREKSKVAVDYIISELKDANYKFNTSKVEKPSDPAETIRRNYLISYIRNCINALRNIGDNRAISVLEDLMNFYDGRINIEVINALKAFIEQKDSTDTVMNILINAAVNSFQQGESAMNAEFIEKCLRAIFDAKSYIKGIVRITVRNNVKILLESNSENILAEAINLVGAIRDRAPDTRRKLEEIRAKFPSLEILISNTLEMLDVR